MKKLFALALMLAPACAAAQSMPQAGFWVDRDGHPQQAIGTFCVPAKDGSGCSSSSGPGGSSYATSRQNYTATAGGTGYSTGDALDRVVTTNPSSGAVVLAYWVNMTQGTLLASAPTAGSYALTPQTQGVTISGMLPAFAATPTFNLGSLNGAATAAKQPAIDTNGDLRVPTVTVTPFFVSIPAATSTEILPAQSSRIGYDIQCTGNVAIGISRTHATLTTSTPAAGANIDLVMPASSTPPQFVPAFVSKLGSTGYAASATACWGQSFAQQ